MFKLAIQLLVLVYIIIMISNLVELKKYNHNGYIINSKNKETVYLPVRLATYLLNEKKKQLKI